jgi:hypothetical protein
VECKVLEEPSATAATKVLASASIVQHTSSSSIEHASGCNIVGTEEEYAFSRSTCTGRDSTQDPFFASWLPARPSLSGTAKGPS